jgi:hypothetical protein
VRNLNQVAAPGRREGPCQGGNRTLYINEYRSAGEFGGRVKIAGSVRQFHGSAEPGRTSLVRYGCRIMACGAGGRL